MCEQPSIDLTPTRRIFYNGRPIDGIHNNHKTRWISRINYSVSVRRDAIQRTGKFRRTKLGRYRYMIKTL